MSIIDDLSRLEREGKLHRFAPGNPLRLKRRLFFTNEVGLEINDPMSSLSRSGSKGESLAGMTRWVKGGLVYSENGKPAFLKRLVPPPGEIWEMRITKPHVQVRIFGRFAYENTLVLTHIYPRDAFGHRNSRRWRRAMSDCETSWNKMFASRAPFRGATIHDYVTEHCDDFEI